jgi:SH3-like domain-containing protein
MAPCLLAALLVLAASPALAQRPLPVPPPWPEAVPPPPRAAPAPTPPVPTRPAETARGPETGLPQPRYVSLGSPRVNLRTGPGTQHPAEWTYQRNGWPVEIVREFGHWRRIRDHEGVEGWVQQNFLSGRRTLVVRGETRKLLRRPEESAPVIARLSPGVLGQIRRCEAGSPWCEVEVRGNRGWLLRAWFWGTYAGEEVK